jgi:hypothetical protein
VSAALIPVAVLAGILQPHDYLPQHGGIYLFAFLFLLGAALGYRALLLLLVGCVAVLIRGQTQCVSQEECVYGFAIIYLAPFLSIPAAAGGSASWLFRAIVRRFFTRSVVGRTP